MLIYATRGMIADGDGVTGLTVAVRIPVSHVDPNAFIRKCSNCGEETHADWCDQTDARVSQFDNVNKISLDSQENRIKQYDDVDVKIKIDG